MDIVKSIRTTTMTVAFKDKQPLIVSPAALRRAGFRTGQELEVKVTGGAITIFPKAPAAGDQPFTPAERRATNRSIAASEKDYKAGRSYGPFKTHDAFVAVLHQEAGKLRAKKSKRAEK
jgi:hypothetical protein